MRSLGILAILLAPHLAAAATLSGQVRDVTGAAVPYARVELALEGSSGGGSEQHADNEGWFRFSWLPEGVYRLKITVPGFVQFRLKSISIAEGEQKHLPPMTLELGRFCEGVPVVEYYQQRRAAPQLGNLSGHVKQIEDGPAVGNARVMLLCGDQRVCGETKTDSQGAFIFFNLRTGEYALRVTHFGYYPLEQPHYEVQSGFDQTYEPLFLEHCPNGNCDPRLRPKRPLIVCE